MQPRCFLTETAPDERTSDRDFLPASYPLEGATHIASTSENKSPVELDEGGFVLDATLIGELLNVESTEVSALMRGQHITSICESGVDADHGTFRLNLFYRGRHARLRIDTAGRILQRSVIDFGERSLPRREAKSSRSAANR